MANEEMKLKYRSDELEAKRIKEQAKKEILDKLHLARQCLNFKGFTCENKNCLNTYCPLNVNFEKLKQEAK